MFYQVMRTELIKLRRAPVWIAFFAPTALSAVMGTFNYPDKMYLQINHGDFRPGET